jgi:hypothetical protein
MKAQWWPDLDPSGAVLDLIELRTAYMLAWACRISHAVIGKHGVDITPCASKVGISLFIK